MNRSILFVKKILYCKARGSIYIRILCKHMRIENIEHLENNMASQ